jgi:hypothetical protein
MKEKPGPFTLVSAKFSGLDNPEKLLKFVLDLDKKRTKAPVKGLQVVSPNWVMSGDPSDPGSTGGPGARPVPYIGQPNTQEHQFHIDPLPTDMPFQKADDHGGAGVDVVVLDTVPTDSLDNIYNKWVKTAAQKHTLLETLLDENNRLLEVVGDPLINMPSQDIEPNPPGLLQADDHDYPMSDHGLFVAGIIHTLAPKAKIYLYQVLNRYGVGDLMSLARGLEKVITRFPDGNVSVNASLTMQLPLEEAHITTEDPKGKALGMSILNQKRSWFAELICAIVNWLCLIIELILHIRLPGCESSWFERQALPLLSICRSITTLGSDIIAAAGNKGKGGNRPQAEFPAAFPEVLGVGALPKNDPPANPNTRLDTAPYSNFSDWPQGSGIATLGGDRGEGKGILGIYLGEFPGEKDNTLPPTPTPSSNGWGWWCGTSFATAVMTGLTANMLSNMPSGSTPREAINKLFEAQPYLTKQDEDVVFVKQR